VFDADNRRTKTDVLYPRSWPARPPSGYSSTGNAHKWSPKTTQKSYWKWLEKRGTKPPPNLKGISAHRVHIPRNASEQQKQEIAEDAVQILHQLVRNNNEGRLNFDPPPRILVPNHSEGLTQGSAMKKFSPCLNRLQYKDSFIRAKDGSEVKGTLPGFFRRAAPFIADAILTGNLDHARGEREEAKPLEVRARGNFYGRG